MLETTIKTETLTFAQRRSLSLLLIERLEWLGSYKTSNASLVYLQELGLVRWVAKKNTREEDRYGYWELAKTREAEIHATRSAATLFYVGSVKTLKAMLELRQIRDPRIYKIKPASIRCLHRYRMIAPIKNSEEKGWKMTELGIDAAEYMNYLDTLPDPEGTKRKYKANRNSAN